MKKLSTSSGRPFQYKEYPDGDIIVYSSDADGNLQEKSAIAITPYTINIIRQAIQRRKEIALGASRDKPSLDSLGALLKSEGQSPQQLSYLIPILAQAGICRVRRQGRAFIVVRVEK